MSLRQIPAATLDQQEKRVKEKIEIVQAPSLLEIPWLLHGFSTRPGGNSIVYAGSRHCGALNLGFTDADNPRNVFANRERFVEALTADGRFPLVTVRQIHSATVRILTSVNTEAHSSLAEGDGLITSMQGVLLGIQTADCIPVLIADRRRRAVGAFHAGWRGTAKRIVEDGVRRMRLEFGSTPEDLVAAIGPGIGPCCYEVGQDVMNVFMSELAYAKELFREAGDHGHGKPHLDLAEANRRQLLGAGLAADAISVVSECTSCATDRYFSYRAERGFTGRMLSVIGIRRG